MTWFSALSWILGFGAVLLGNWLEGGHVTSLLQGSAFLIVMGGTVGATMLSHGPKSWGLAMRLLPFALGRPLPEFPAAVTLRNWVAAFKKSGVEGLTAQLTSTTDPFLKESLQSVLDGMSPQDLEDILAARLELMEQQLMRGAKVFLDAGGFAPTMGILGAVLGLIHVMANLTDTSQLGAGIAVAFVATIYGVAFANLLFIPLGNKIKQIVEEMLEQRRAFVRGLLAFVQNQSLLIIESKTKAADWVSL